MWRGPVGLGAKRTRILLSLINIEFVAKIGNHAEDH
jgi:hypothetical protein